MAQDKLNAGLSKRTIIRRRAEAMDETISLSQKEYRAIRTVIETDLAERVNLQIYPLEIIHDRLFKVLQEEGKSGYSEWNPIVSALWVAIQNIRRELGLSHELPSSEEGKECQK